MQLILVRFIIAHVFISLCCCHQIITKEIEVNEWKTKYEESRAEVLEMRYQAQIHSNIEK